MPKINDKKPIVGIIGGTSQFGQWFRFFFEKNGCECLVAGRKTELTPAELAKKADIVIVSVPVRETASVIRKIRNSLKPSALLCDFTSVKEEPLAEMLERKKGGVLGMHPLFGPLVPSMEGQIIVFCKGRKNRWVEYLERLFAANGAKVKYMKAVEHDRQMAMVQAMTHFTNIAFAKVLQKQKMEPKSIFATPVFRLQAMLMGRILGANLPLYVDLEIRNKSFLKVLADYLAEVERLAGEVFRGETEKLEKEFLASARDMRGFIPIAQQKTTEIIHLLVDQPVELKKRKKINIGAGKRGLKIACLGPEGTHSHIASEEIFSKKANFIMAPTIRKAFEKVKNGQAQFAVVPAENSIAGIVQDTIDSLLDFPLSVVGSYNKKIHHCLLARTADRNRIRVIKSHIQPLNQCKDWLSRNFPSAILSTESSSTEAILSTTDPSVAFIANKEAAKKYDLKILASNIEDHKENYTEFYVLARSARPKISKRLKPRHTLMIVTAYDRPGLLRDVLNIFADQKLNLAKLHSRKSIVKGWDYYFFLEVECLPDDQRFKRAQQEVKKLCPIARVLGVV